MNSTGSTRVLIVANRTAATPRLLEEVRARARRSPCTFTLLVPRPYWDPDTEESAVTLELAIPLLSEAAAEKVVGIVGDTDPFVGIPTADASDARWVRPELVGEVEFAEFTPGGILRHARWRGLRPDRSPGDVRRDDA